MSNGNGRAWKTPVEVNVNEVPGRQQPGKYDDFLALDILAQSAILKGRNVSLEAMNRNRANGFFMPFIQPLFDAIGRGIGSTQKRATVGAAKIASRLPIPRPIAFFCLEEFQMSGSNEVTTVVRESAESLTTAPTRHYWNLFATDGPADLYRGFAMDAVDEFLKIQGGISDTQMGLLMDAVNVAVFVVLKAAHVEDSWLPQYEAVTAHLKNM